MKKYILATLISLFLSAPVLAKPAAKPIKNDMEIVATVGNDIISSMDVKSRMDLAVTSSGLPPTKEMKDKLYQQILKNLIDESLYKQEAEKLKITVNDEDLNNAVMALEQKNNIKAGTFKEFLKTKKVSYDLAIDQLKSQLIWNKVIAAKVRPKIVVTEREAEETMEHISHSAGMSELLISEIVLPFDNEKDAKRVKALSEKLANELKKGTDFAAVAKEFSRGSTAEAGGDLGWMREEQVQKSLLAKVRNLRNGEISDPFIVDNNYHIAKLNDRRALVNTEQPDGEVEMKQAFVPVAAGLKQNQEDEISGNIEKQGKSFKSCADFDTFAKNVNSQVEAQMIKSKITDLNGEIRTAVSGTPVGKLTPIIHGPGGFYIFAVCKKPAPVASLVDKNKVMDLILRNKIEVQAQEYLRDLRKNAFIEIRP
jgi:peptidyl-prolyl cis-trans isomerase SurA